MKVYNALKQTEQYGNNRFQDLLRSVQPALKQTEQYGNIVLKINTNNRFLALKQTEQYGNPEEQGIDMTEEHEL